MTCNLHVPKQNRRAPGWVITRSVLCSARWAEDDAPLCGSAATCYDPLCWLPPAAGCGRAVARWIGDRRRRRGGRWHRPGYGQRLGGLTSPGPRAYAYIIYYCSLYVWPRASPPSLGQSDLIASVDPEISRSDRRYTDLLGRINLVRPLRNLYCITLYY